FSAAGSWAWPPVCRWVFSARSRRLPRRSATPFIINRSRRSLRRLLELPGIIVDQPRTHGLHSRCIRERERHRTQRGKAAMFYIRGAATDLGQGWTRRDCLRIGLGGALGWLGGPWLTASPASEAKRGGGSAKSCILI